MLPAVAYLGFQKWGAKCFLDTSAHTKGEAKPSFPIFLLCQKKIFCQRRGPWPNGPPKYASGFQYLQIRFKLRFKRFTGEFLRRPHKTHSQSERSRLRCIVRRHEPRAGFLPSVAFIRTGLQCGHCDQAQVNSTDAGQADQFRRGSRLTFRSMYVVVTR